MKSSTRNIGAKLYEMIEDKGLPWGVGTTALIAGLGVRLINLSFSVSKMDNEIEKERIRALFVLCDEDDRIFQQIVSDNESNSLSFLINQVPLQLLEQIIMILKETVGYDDKIKENVKVDYVMGLSYLRESAFQLLHIIYDNLTNMDNNLEVKQNKND